MSFDLELCNTGDLVGAGLGWRLANDDWDAGRRRERREELLAELAAWVPPKRRERRPTLESQVRQVFRAARAAGVTITVTIEGEAGKVTATPVKGAAVAAADSDFNEWDQDLGTHPPEVRQ